MLASPRRARPLVALVLVVAAALACGDATGPRAPTVAGGRFALVSVNGSRLPIRSDADGGATLDLVGDTLAFGGGAPNLGPFERVTARRATPPGGASPEAVTNRREGYFQMRRDSVMRRDRVALLYFDGPQFIETTRGVLRGDTLIVQRTMVYRRVR
jgi:hypothetical protein